MLLAFNNESYTFTEFPFTRAMYQVAAGDGNPETKRNVLGHWYSEKQNLDSDFPNLPHLITDDAGIISESLAILRYIARRHEQLGSTELERARTDTFTSAYYDMRVEIR